jgi:hypothetical protein
MTVENFGNKTGFRVLDYFVTFPDGDFIKEDENGKIYAIADIYYINKDKSVTKVKQLTPEIEDLIGEQINKFLLEALNEMRGNGNE